MHSVCLCARVRACVARRRWRRSARTRLESSCKTTWRHAAGEVFEALELRRDGGPVPTVDRCRDAPPKVRCSRHHSLGSLAAFPAATAAAFPAAATGSGASNAIAACEAFADCDVCAHGDAGLRADASRESAFALALALAVAVASAANAAARHHASAHERGAPGRVTSMRAAAVMVLAPQGPRPARQQEEQRDRPANKRAG